MHAVPKRNIKLDLYNFLQSKFIISITVLLFFTFYVALSMVAFAKTNNINYVILSIFTIFSIFTIIVFYNLNINIKLFSKIKIRQEDTVIIFFLITLFAASVIVVTAPTLPIVSALAGASGNQLSYERAQFSKIRTGWEFIIPYLNSALTTTVMPYLVALCFISNSKYKWFILIFCVAFCQISLEKSLFIKVLLPLLFLIALAKIGKLYFLIPFLFSIAIILQINTIITKSHEVSIGTESNYENRSIQCCDGNISVDYSNKYFSSRYKPVSSLDYIIWRGTAVFIFTAADSIYTFEKYLGGKFSYGATSAPIAKLIGVERVQLDALVFGVQWGEPGKPSDSGRANSFFVTEAYVNFGWLGIFVFSAIVGLVLRMFEKSSDWALKSMFPVFVYNIFSAGLIGTMMSSGFLFLFVYAALFSFTKKEY